MIEVIIEQNSDEVEVDDTSTTKIIPIDDIWEKLLETDKLLNHLQNDYVLGDELFNWCAEFAVHKLKFRRLIQDAGSLRKRGT